MTGEQLGFGFEEMLSEQEMAHLPDTMEAAIPFYRGLLEKHHAAMMAGDEAGAMAIRKEAHDLAEKLNGGTSLGILGNEQAPGCVLERETAAPPGTMPLRGQLGEFTTTVGKMKVRVEQDGLFGVAASFSPWLGFSAHVVDTDKPILSETGYRSFFGCHADMVPGITPERITQRDFFGTSGSISPYGPWASLCAIDRNRPKYPH